MFGNGLWKPTLLLTEFFVAAVSSTMALVIQHLIVTTTFLRTATTAAASVSHFICRAECLLAIEQGGVPFYSVLTKYI